MGKDESKKGERYWYIIFNNITGEIWVNSRIDNGCSYDEARFCNGNYFHSEEEAESMVRKLRAVLKGAEVIEMPSGEEIDEVEYTPMEVAESFNNVDKGQVFSFGIRYGIDYLKSKIVK